MPQNGTCDSGQSDTKSPGTSTKAGRDKAWSEYRAAYHSASEERLSALLSRIKAEALCEIASKCRYEKALCEIASKCRDEKPIPCKISALATSLDAESRVKLISTQMGGQNLHLDVLFEDDETWIARIQQDHPRMPPAPVRELGHS
ncbi:hypothetical protein M501DRAFT_1031868 [Patellaria atrata CBS 101060]|uniref:Uncharacterized protein n=1 Tax=Patellaria atrata CBS 101060 TaxID=1346257 RepID=A0A9P4SA30_9PEZI|nr:hypothetical protein M501DRAFT_1031868 [Patellaria atrata CBS 101060]